MQYRCLTRLSNSIAEHVPALLRQCQAKPCDAIPWQFHSMRFHAVSQRITATFTLNGSKPYRCPSLPCRRISCLSTTPPLRCQAFPRRFHTAPCLRPGLRILSASVPSHAVPFQCFSLPFLCVSLASLCDSNACHIAAVPSPRKSVPSLCIVTIS